MKINKLAGVAALFYITIKMTRNYQRSNKNDKALKLSPAKMSFAPKRGDKADKDKTQIYLFT